MQLRVAVYVAVVAALVIGGAVAYDVQHAFLALDWANAVKCEPKKILKWRCGEACKDTGFLENITLVDQDSLEVRGFVAYDPARNWIVWSFRSTKTDLNWIEDFEVKLVNYSSHQAQCGGDCLVHEGFYTTYSFLAQTLVPAYQQLAQAYPTAATFITGHSLGAAQCQLALLDVLTMRPGHNVTLYDFGCPRIGNPAFADWAAGLVVSNNAHVYRVVNDNDPVPMLPFDSMDYQHFPRDFIWYSPNLPTPGYVLCNNTGVQMDEIQARDNASSSSSSANSSPSSYNGQCGGNLAQANKTDHEWYLGVHMVCRL